jgi:hypothetical protein
MKQVSAVCIASSGRPIEEEGIEGMMGDMSLGVYSDVGETVIAGVTSVGIGT